MRRPKKRIAESRFILSALVGPQDANKHDNVHGGVMRKHLNKQLALPKQSSVRPIANFSKPTKRRIQRDT